MVYNEMFKEYKKFVGLSDEDIADYITENNIDETDGMHIWFEFVVTPIILEAIKTKNNEILIKSFEFIEECLKSNDTDITEVVEFSLLEGIIAEIGDEVNEIDIYFGDETMQSIESIKKYIFSK